MKPILCVLMVAMGTLLWAQAPLTTTGPEFPEIDKVNQILRAFQEKYQLPGVSLAISYKNRLIYSGSVGYADKEAGTALTPAFRMRIASVTKPITATAVMKLVETKRLSLDSPVFGKGSVLEGDFEAPLFNGQPSTMTIRHLLTHTSGGWGNSQRDPMFASQTIALDGKPFIEKVLRDFALTSAPGTTYDYSNFGYYLLGRVIEKVSGMPYEQYVKTAVLAPSGITDMAIGTLATAPDEVKYYGTLIDDPTFAAPAHMDSHGGWTATTTDLLKFLAGIDKFDNSTRVLTNQSIDVMVAPSKANGYYASGFSVNKYNNWWHTGSLPGVSAEIGRASEGYCWAVLVNTRTSVADRNQFSADLDQLFWKVKESVKRWPAGAPL